jgi:hypothetical protein
MNKQVRPTPRTMPADATDSVASNDMTVDVLPDTALPILIMFS